MMVSRDRSDPTVSVIIACHNHGTFLPHALDSVLNQSFSSWEAIVVDDGSTDDTRQRASEFTDLRILYVHQEHRGVSAARNVGIGLASGEYLAFLDADDEWDQRFLDVCVSELRSRENLACVVSQARFIDGSGSLMPGRCEQHVGAQDFQAKLLEGGFFPLNCALCRAHAVRQAGMFDESLHYVEDWDLWLRIQAGGGAIATFPDILARYRMLPGSAYTNVPLMHSSRMPVLTKMLSAPEGDPSMWSADKRRAYALAHRAAAIGYLQRRETELAWYWMSESATTWPDVLTRLDTYYELALGDQQRGYRGVAHMLDIPKNGAEMIRRLGLLFAEGGSAVQLLRRRAYGQAYLALAILCDQAGEWRQARGYLLRAAWSYPPLLSDVLVLRRIVKFYVGKRISDRIPAMRLDRASRRGDVEV